MAMPQLVGETLSASWEAELQTAFAKIHDATRAEKMPDAALRRDRLARLNNALLDHSERLIAAVDADFGGRSSAETQLAEIYPVLDGIRYQRKHLSKWMKTRSRSTPLMLQPAKVELQIQPLGVVGIVVPWNFPIMLGFSPLVGALAAGNRAMIKTSEFAPRTGDAVAALIDDAFAPDEVSVVQGGVEVARAFTSLAFDHLVFTGSTAVGRKVMAAAAENLTPVTLELGGKSPAIVHHTYDTQEAAKRIAFSKGMNAGQICVAPDYVLCPRNKVDAFAEAFEQAFSSNYPTLLDNADYTSIITNNQHARLQKWLADARSKGATVTEINPAEEDFSGSRKTPMYIVRDGSDEMTLMQEEIFGPILPIVPYDTLDDAIAYVNERARPLALYYFDSDAARANQVLAETHSGGACINDTLSQVVAEAVPFGGIGPSGMGHYHGPEGFLNFSKQKAVVRRGSIYPLNWIGPPWRSGWFKRLQALQSWRFRRL
ncbi:MAG: coniferyl aldehyde dehydrogenase [Pseudomonadota bacterium]